MYKVLFIDLKEKFPIYEVLEQKIFEVEFVSYSEKILDTLINYNILLLYQPIVNYEIINKLRKFIKFHNIKLIVFSEEIDEKIEHDAISNGADVVSIVPNSTSDLINLLQNYVDILDKKNNFNHDAIHPFLLAVNEIFSTMAFLNVEHVCSYYSPDRFHFGNISGLMALTGERKGMIVVSMYEELARKLISNIMAIPGDQLSTEEVEDGVGELINMIAGGAKARLTDEHEHFQLSAPSIITGLQHRIIQKKEIPCVVMLFKHEEEYFAVRLCLLSLTK